MAYGCRRFRAYHYPVTRGYLARKSTPIIFAPGKIIAKGCPLFAEVITKKIRKVRLLDPGPSLRSFCKS
jgi:hypothetical protein